MTVQMLFYEDAVPVSSTRHAGCSVEARDHGFCRRVNSVPLTAVEFRSAAAEYPIVFVGDRDTVQPAAVLGLRAGENLLVSEEGAWLGRYIPAFVRRYPFVFSAGPEDGRFVLCVDEAFPGFNREGRGEALFSPEGDATAYVGRVLRFLQEYRSHFLRTRRFCRELMDLDLLQPMEARYSMAGKPQSIAGFSAVDRERLKQLSGDALARLVASDQLELVYLHLQSLRNFDVLRARLPLPAPLPLPAEPTAAADAARGVTLH